MGNPSTSALDVEYLSGIHLTESVLWMDAPRQVDLCFVSHAHLPRALAHGKVLCTAATARLARLDRGRVLVCPFYRRFGLGGLDLELQPAGHLLGSAQLVVTRADRRLVYTGHFQLEPRRTVEAARPLEADVLVLHAGATRPGLRLPPREQEEQALLGWVGERLAVGAQPVLLAATLGTAQELAALLGEQDIRVRAHREVYQHCRTHHALGVRLPAVRSFRGTPAQGEVVLFPPELARTRAIDSLPRARLALVGARWAERPGEALRGRVERCFALSSTADHPQIVRYATDSRARRIHVVGLHAGPLAADLRERGLRAWPLRPPEQLDLFAHCGQRAAS